MAYTPKTWVNSDPITASDLNRIETGIDNVDTLSTNLDTYIQAGITYQSAEIAAGSSAEYTVTLPNVMPDTNYIVMTGLQANNINARELSVWGYPVSTSQIKVGIANSSPALFPANRYTISYIVVPI